jgi:hypothetical protein
MDDRTQTKAAAPDQESAAFQNTEQQNHTASRPNTTDADEKIIKSRSTSTETQIKKLVALLREGPKTTHSLRQQGISHPAGRIRDLRDYGYLINAERVKAIDSDSFIHINTARYALLKEPPHQHELPGVPHE